MIAQKLPPRTREQKSPVKNDRAEVATKDERAEVAEDDENAVTGAVKIQSTQVKGMESKVLKSKVWSLVMFLPKL